MSGLEVPAVGEIYHLNAFLDSDLKLQVNTDKERYAPGEAIPISASLIKDGTPLPGATAWVEVKRPDGAVYQLPLYDDGTHGDKQAGDGVYTNSFAQTSQVGYYLLSGGLREPLRLGIQAVRV